MRVGGRVSAFGRATRMVALAVTLVMASHGSSVAAATTTGTTHGNGRHNQAARAGHTANPASDPAEVAAIQQLTHVMLLPGYISYVVRQGDTVESIAKRFHDVAWLIRRRNGGLWSMAPGQTIKVWQWPFGAPYYATRVERTDKPQFYTVQVGDTLGAIAAHLHTDVQTLASENGIADAAVIYAGQTLVHHHYSYHTRRALVPGVPASMLHTGLLMRDVANLVGVDAALVEGVGWHETRWTMVRGASGEYGIMQIMPYMANWVQRALIGYKLDPNVRENNILEGALLLQYYLDLTRGDTHRSLALYHSGDTRADPRNGAYIRASLQLRDYFYHHPRAGF